MKATALPARPTVVVDRYVGFGYGSDAGSWDHVRLYPASMPTDVGDLVAGMVCVPVGAHFVVASASGSIPGGEADAGMTVRGSPGRKSWNLGRHRVHPYATTPYRLTRGNT